MAKQQQHVPEDIRHSVLSLLIFHDDCAKLIRNSLELELWNMDNSMFAMVKSIYDFIDAYHKAPGSAHIYEMIYALPIPKAAHPTLFERVNELQDNMEYVNVEFTINRLEQFHRRLTYEAAIQQASQYIKQGECDKVEEILQAAIKRRLTMFDPGTTLLESMTRRLMASPEEADRDRIYLGIPALDRRGLVPTRKKLVVIGAGPKKGKSWFLIHCAKQALKQGKRVVYITLELDKDLVAERIVQSIYAVTKREAEQLTRLAITPQGFNIENAPQLKCLYSDGEADRIVDRLKKDRYINNNLRVKEFPMDTLTFEALNAYLDNLESQSDFSPDLLIVDYGKLMYKGGRDDYRVLIGRIYERLRKVATERNVAVVTAAQLNRTANHVKRSNDDQIGEDYSIIATCDLFLTYNQTDLEYDLKLARLYVSQARDEEGGFEIYLTQDYASGQFVVSCAEATSDWKSRYDSLMQTEDKKRDKGKDRDKGGETPPKGKGKG